MSESDQALAGKYRMIAELGRGGMAEVNLAVASGPAGFNKLVVIKQLRQNLSDDPEFLSMFLDEARLAARLNHPNVVHTYEVVSEGGQNFIAMEYLDGQPLNRIIRDFSKSGGVPLGISLRIICDALAGLHYAHELADYDGTLLNVVHRDISPHNIFVTYEGQTKVVDFGIAKALNSSSETRSGVIKGKISYMSPEQSRSEPLDRRSDIFAAGIILWEAVTGRRLWKGLADVTVLQRLMVSHPVPSPREANPEVSKELEAICIKALASSPEDRYATAADMQNDIENVLLDMRLRVSVRDISKLLNEKFAAERAEIRAVIDTQIKQQTGENSRMMALSTLSQSQTLSAQSQGTPVTQHTQHTLQHTSQTALEPVSSTGTGLSPPVSTLTLSSSSETSEQPTPQQSALKARLAAASLGLVLLGSAGWMLSRSSSPAPVAAAAQPASASKIALNLRASPAGAKLYLDDELLPTNPYAGFRPRDGSAHLLRVEAEGYASKSRPVSFDSDISLDLDLEKATPAASVSQNAEAPAPQEPPKTTAVPDSKKKGGGRAVEAKTAEAPKTPEPPAVQPAGKKANVKLDTDNPWRLIPTMLWLALCSLAGLAVIIFFFFGRLQEPEANLPPVIPPSPPVPPAPPAPSTAPSKRSSRGDGGREGAPRGDVAPTPAASGGTPASKAASKPLPRLHSRRDEPEEDATGLTLLSPTVFAQGVPQQGLRAREEGAETDEQTGLNELILVTAVAHTDKGLRRRHNEDSYLALEEEGVFLVADGMGGHLAGEVASQLAAQTVSEVFKTRGFPDKLEEGIHARASELVHAVEAANAAVHEKSLSDGNLHGMGTTMVAARFSRSKRRAYVANVGDSRCYRLRGGELKQLTVDHTIGAATGDRKSVV